MSNISSYHSDQLMSQSAEAADRIIKASPQAVAPKVATGWKPGYFIGLCVHFAASFGTSKERTENQGKHNEVKQAIGELYGNKLAGGHVGSYVIERLVQTEYSKFFASDIEKGVAPAPEKIKSFSQKMHQDPLISEQIKLRDGEMVLANLVKEMSAPGVVSSVSGPKEKRNSSNVFSKFAGMVMNFSGGGAKLTAKNLAQRGSVMRQRPLEDDMITQSAKKNPKSTGTDSTASTSRSG